MIVVVMAVMGVVAALAMGADLSLLADLRFRAVRLLAGAMVIQILITTVAADAMPGSVLEAVHIVTYLMAGGFLILNAKLPGLLPLAGGGLSNFAAIAVNGGVMPARPGALEMAGIHTDGFSNSAVVANARLSVLGDVFAIPAEWPLANVFSLGDLFIALGVAVMVHGAGTRLPMVSHWSDASLL